MVRRNVLDGSLSNSRFSNSSRSNSSFSNSPLSDDRGITLPTVILSAVLALAAAAAGVVIYNAVRSRANTLDEIASVVEGVEESFDRARRIERQLIPDRLADRLFEGDEPETTIKGDGISDVFYLAEGVCPNLETRHWHSTIDNGRDTDSTEQNRDATDNPADRVPKKLYPQVKQRGGLIANSPYRSNPTITTVSKNWIEADGSTVILSPIYASDRCSYKATDDYTSHISDLSMYYKADGSPSFVTTAANYTNDLPLLKFTALSPLRYSDCLRSGLTPVSILEKSTCELHFKALTVNNSERINTGSVGAVQRASWQLISYCAIKGGFIPFVPIPSTVRETYETTNFNQCVVSLEDTDRTCSLAGLGLRDSISETTPLQGFYVSGIDQRCTITETSRVPSMVAVDGTTRISYTPLPSPAPEACVYWRVEEKNYFGSRFGSECQYTPKFTITKESCEAVGLKLKVKIPESACYYKVTDQNPECPEIFKVNRETGKAQCQEPLGNVPAQWERVCLGWQNTISTVYNERGTAVSDDLSSVYAYYSSDTDTYRCSFKNRHTNGARECLSFGYEPGATAGECEVIGRRSYNPRPYAPTCAVMRATPYHTSQDQLFSITGLELAFRNRGSISGASPSDITPAIKNNTTPDSNDFFYDYNRNVFPNINSQLPYYYDRIIKPAVESYLTSGTRYTELWLPSQFPTGNVSVSRTFGQNGYPSKTSKDDPTETSPVDFVYSRRSPSALNNCDDYKQFYRPLHIEKSSSSTETYTVGYNDQNKSLICGTTDKNFWEPRYYLDVLTTQTSYPAGNHCPSSTTVCAGKKTGTNLYRECGLVGTDTSFTRPAEISNSAFDFQNDDKSHPINTFVKECQDIGYTKGDTELFDYKDYASALPKRSNIDEDGIEVIPPGSYTGSIVADSLILPTKHWVSPAREIIQTYHDRTSSPSARDQLRFHYNFWVRSDAREDNLNPETLFYLLTDEGLKWTRYGLTEMLNHIQSQTLSNKDAVLRFSNSANFNARNHSSVFAFQALWNPDMPSAGNAGYFSGGGFGAHRGGASSNLTYYAPYSEQTCEFKVQMTASAQVQAFFRACQSLGTYFPTRFSYHKPIEVKNFAAESIIFRTDGTLPTQDNFGHWRSALLTEESNGVKHKHPSLIKYGNANYNPPTYFHLKTDRSNGYFYCEANPDRGTEAGKITATRTSANTYTVNNSACQKLNDALVDTDGKVAKPNSTSFETISEMSSNSADIEAASALGFVGHKEGPYDYYPCKWRAPFKGNPFGR